MYLFKLFDKCKKVKAEISFVNFETDVYELPEPELHYYPQAVDGHAGTDEEIQYCSSKVCDVVVVY